MIVKKNAKYVVKSESGKVLSKPMSKKAAEKRLQEIDYFKHQSKK